MKFKTQDKVTLNADRSVGRETIPKGTELEIVKYVGASAGEEVYQAKVTKSKVTFGVGASSLKKVEERKIGFLDLVEELLSEVDEPINYSEPTGCEWYKKGFCRIDGVACPYSQETYELCPKKDYAEKHPEKIKPVIDK
jgi:translation elongation factor EF-1beta